MYNNSVNSPDERFQQRGALVSGADQSILFIFIYLFAQTW